MRGMASAKDSRPCPPNGRYPFNITASESGLTNIKDEGKPTQKGGDTCLKLSLEIAEGEFAGYPTFDTLGTDGGTNFGGMSKKRLRALDVQGLDSDAEIPDEIIAQSLLHKRVWAEVEREPQEKKNEATGKWEPIYDIDEKTGVKVVKYKLKIVGYLRQPQAQALPGQPQQGQQLAPQQGQYIPPQYPAPGAPGQLPQSYPTQLPQGGFPGAPGGGFPGGYPAPAPGGYAMPPGAPGGFPQVQAPQGWVQAPPNGVPGTAPQGGPGFPGQQQLPNVPGR